jgi:hypothetical protein
MYNTETNELAPPGGFPKQRISDYNVDIIPPPSVYNLYSDVSRLPVYEDHFDEKLMQPGGMVRVTGEPKVSEGSEGVGALWTKLRKDRIRLSRALGKEASKTRVLKRWR